jgi:hypothetical protein
MDRVEGKFNNIRNKYCFDSTQSAKFLKNNFEIQFEILKGLKFNPQFISDCTHI